MTRTRSRTQAHACACVCACAHARVYTLVRDGFLLSVKSWSSTTNACACASPWLRLHCRVGSTPAPAPRQVRAATAACNRTRPSAVRCEISRSFRAVLRQTYHCRIRPDFRRRSFYSVCFVIQGALRGADGVRPKRCDERARARARAHVPMTKQPKGEHAAFGLCSHARFADFDAFLPILIRGACFFLTHTSDRYYRSKITHDGSAFSGDGAEPHPLRAQPLHGRGGHALRVPARLCARRREHARHVAQEAGGRLGRFAGEVG
eukprot:269262-Pleurochrysis_carterae.AAC.3